MFVASWDRLILFISASGKVWRFLIRSLLMFVWGCGKWQSHHNQWTHERSRRTRSLLAPGENYLFCVSPVQHDQTLHRCLIDYVQYLLWLDMISFMCEFQSWFSCTKTKRIRRCKVSKLEALTDVQLLKVSNEYFYWMLEWLMKKGKCNTWYEQWAGVQYRWCQVSDDER